MPDISHPAPLKKFHLSLLTGSLLAAVPAHRPRGGAGGVS